MLSKLIFNSPWYYVLICLATGLLFSILLYYRNKKNKEIPRPVLWLIAAVRFLGVSLLLLLLCDIFLKQVKNETQNPIVLLAIDNSRSMLENTDSTFLKEKIPAELNLLKEEIGKIFGVKTLLFGETSKASEQDPLFNEKETDINNLLTDVENNYSGQNVGALIILSDGIYNKGANPVYQSEKLGYPVYTIAMGDTNELKDISVQKINHNQFAYLGNIFPVEAVIRSKKFAGREVTVTLSSNGVKKGEQKLRISSDNFLSGCNFTISADVAGVQKYTISVSVLEGEKNISNNSQSFLIDVIDSRYKVLLLANFPHPDIAALKDVVANNSSYEMNFSYAAGFKESLKPYNLVIIHGYTNAQSQIITECRNNTIPFWIIHPLTTDHLEGMKISGGFNKQNDAEPLLNNSFGLFTLSHELKKFVKDLPAVKTFFGNYSVSNGAHVLLNQRIGVVETENPIFVFSELSGLKSAVFAGDGLWRWKMRDFAEHNNHQIFNELISKSIQYLSVKNDKSFFRINAPRIVNENEQVQIGAEVYNKSYELITDPEVTLVLTNSEKKQFNFTFGKLNNLYRVNLGFLPAGEYFYEAKVNMDGQVLTKKGNVVVKEIIAEKINTVANHNLLYRLSENTGGKLFYPNDIRKLTEEILKNQTIKPITYSSHQTTTIIDLKWLFGVILFLLAVEWFFRKRYSTI